MIREVNRKKRLSWCLEMRRWLVNDNWDKVIFSDESQIVIGNNNRIYVWRKRREGYIGHWLDMVYLPPQGEFCRPYFS